jgi:uncharacterized membrane protein
MEITHTVGLDNVTVLTDTFSTSPTGAPPQYQWQTQLEWYAPVYTLTFVSELTAMQPGETRQINQGTEVAYRLPSGWNTLNLPPLYVTAARILKITPEMQTVSVGSTAAYTLTLQNPGAASDVFSLDVFGLPAEWLAYPTSVSVPAGAALEVLLGVTPPPDAAPGEMPFAVTVTNSAGAEDMATADLLLVNTLELALDPAEQTAPTGSTATYLLMVTNHDVLDHNYELAATGPALVEMPDTVSVGAGATADLPITVTATSHGPQPFTITVVGSGGSGAADGLLRAEGRRAVGLALDPESGIAGPGTPASFTLTVTNLGDVVDHIDLAVNLPTGWSASLEANGTPVTELSLPPHLFNSADLRLLVTPDTLAPTGVHGFSVTAVSQAHAAVQATVAGSVEVLDRGIQVTISPQQSTLSPLQSGGWQVTLTNVGAVGDTFDLSATGIVALTAAFSSDSVTLSPGQSQTVQLTTEPLPFVLPQTYVFRVAATSTNDSRITGDAQAEVTFTVTEGIELTWLPHDKTVEDALSADYILVITNTGNLATTYQIDLASPELRGTFEVSEVTVPALGSAALPLRVHAAAPGTYTLTATASGTTATDSAVATLTIVGDPEPDPEPDPEQPPDDEAEIKLYLPLVNR